MDSPTKTTWGDAFKDPKVLIVLIPLVFGGLGATATLLMNVGELRADVQHQKEMLELERADKEQLKDNITRMDKLIQDLTQACVRISQ